MIATRIKKRGSDGKVMPVDLKRLGDYIEDAKNQGEKVMMTGCVNGASEDYQQTLTEMLVVQNLNNRTQEKTYHLVISFREEDEKKLNKEVFEDIEKHFAEALGLDDHQRVFGVHKNTQNLHMHVAYNLIHPETHKKAKTLFKDYYKLSKVCREMEEKYGLVIDNGIEEQKKNKDRISNPAKAQEKFTGEKSFQSYVLENRKTLAKEVAEAKNWQEVHEVLAKEGIGIRRIASGLVLMPGDDKKKGTIKASAVHRDMACRFIENRLGPYEAKKEKAPQKKDTGKEKNEPGMEKADGVAEGEDLKKGKYEGASFVEYVGKRKKEISEAVKAAGSWQEVHEALKGYGVRIKPLMNGLSLMPDDGEPGEMVKASAVHRAMSKKAMEDRLGKYEAPVPELEEAERDGGGGRERELDLMDVGMPQREAVDETPQAEPERGETVEEVEDEEETEEDDAVEAVAKERERKRKEERLRRWAEQEKERLLEMARKAEDWNALQQALVESYGLSLTVDPKSGALLVAGDGERLETGEIDEALGKEVLEARWGDFEERTEDKGKEKEKKAKESDGQAKAKEEAGYRKRPAQPESEERDALYAEYRRINEERMKRIQEEKARSKRSFAWMKAKYEELKDDIDKTSTTRRIRWIRLDATRKVYVRALDKEKSDHARMMNKIQDAYGWKDWNGFLKKQAESGNDAALKVLRAREAKEKRKAEGHVAQEAVYLVVGADKDAAKAQGAKWDKSVKRWYAPKGSVLEDFEKWLSKEERSVLQEKVKPEAGKERNPVDDARRLERVERRRVELGGADVSHFDGHKVKVDENGTVIIQLKSGGRIQDTGEEIKFSEESSTRQAAQLYAQQKYGKMISVQDNVIRREHGTGKGFKSHLGILVKCARHGLRALSQLHVVAGLRPRPDVFLQNDAQHGLERKKENADREL